MSKYIRAKRKDGKASVEGYQTNEWNTSYSRIFFYEVNPAGTQENSLMFSDKNSIRVNTNNWDIEFIDPPKPPFDWESVQECEIVEATTEAYGVRARFYATTQPGRFMLMSPSPRMITVAEIMAKYENFKKITEVIK